MSNRRIFRSFLIFAFSFIFAVVSWLDKIYSLGLLGLLPLPKSLSKLIIPVSIIFSVISLCVTVWFVINEFRRINNNISDLRDDVNNNISDLRRMFFSIRGREIVGSGGTGLVETDVIRTHLRMQLGDGIANILIRNTEFPIALVPGGDIALIMDQQTYGDIIRDLLNHFRGYSVDYIICWTTFVPFESLNWALSGYTSTEWNFRDQNNLNFTPPANDCFFNYVSQWNHINGRQIIVLDTSIAIQHPILRHPLNYQKYQNGGDFNVDILKYLSVRYGCCNDVNQFQTHEEDYFLQGATRESIRNEDSSRNDIKWISLAQIRNIVDNVQSGSNRRIHNIDFVYFNRPGNDFALVRIDANNNFSINNGILGVTFIIFVSENLEMYSNIFNVAWDQSSLTFQGLTRAKL